MKSSRKRVIWLLLLTLLLAFSTILLLKKKSIEIVFISGVSSPFFLELELNGVQIFSDTIEKSEIIHPRYKVETSSLKNTLHVLNEEYGINESYKFYCLFDKWVTLVFYEEKPNGNDLKVTIESNYSEYFGW